MKTMEERFWEKVDRREHNECWNWLAGDNSRGYGVIWANGTMSKAHRISWEMHNGKIPKDDSFFKTLHVLHKCDNKKCVNPNHLFLGTQYDNMKDMENKNRGICGELRSNAKLNETTVRVCRRYHPAISMGKLAEIFDVCESTIWKAISRKRWRHVQ